MANDEKTVVLNVEGMSCGHCKAAVERAVSALSGVSNVSVDLAAKTATILYNPGKTNEEEFKTTIEDQGYDVV